MVIIGKRLPTPSPPALVAHRGYPARFPENTLAGLAAAIDAGARYVEFDVQLSRDAVPVLLHDTDLARTSRRAGLVTDLSREQLRDVDVGEPRRFGDRFLGTPLPLLREAVELLVARPAVVAFVEIKRESLDRFGDETVVDAALRELVPLRHRAVIISFASTAILHARVAGDSPIGLILESTDAPAHRSAERLAPDYVFCNQRLLPESSIERWSRPWRLAIYTVNDVRTAGTLGRLGAHLIETDDFGRLATELADHHGPAD